MKCAGCVKVVEKQLTQHPDVISACVNLVTEVAVVECVVQLTQRLWHRNNSSWIHSSTALFPRKYGATEEIIAASDSESQRGRFTRHGS